MDINISELVNELVYRSYIMSRDQLQEHQQDLTVREYIALHRISSISSSPVIYKGRVYLKDIAEDLRLTIRQTSHIAEDLKNRGLVIWSHDGDGSEGTYLEITEIGKKKLSAKEKELNEYYGRVIKKYGKANTVVLLQMMKKLENVIESEFEELKEKEHDERPE